MKAASLCVIAALAIPAPPALAQLTEEQAAGAGPQEDVLSALTPEGLLHFNAAQEAAGALWPGPLQLCNQARPRHARWTFPSGMEQRGAGPTNADLLRLGKTREQFIAEGGHNVFAPEPTKLFDNLYYLGIESVSAWAVDTSDGIILIDSLENGAEWRERIEPGMRKLGLDPARIKDAVLTHAHGDHFGGSAYLKQRYGARVLMSAVDWELAPRMLDKPYFEPPPPQDMVITDGQQLTLGGQTIGLYLTPGHTRGTVSVIVPVTDNGRPHVAMLWGGTGFNFPHVPDRFTAYSDAAVRFAGIAGAAGVDVPLSPHPDFDGSIYKIRRIAVRQPGEPHPFVVGQDAAQRFLKTAAECALAYRAQLAAR